MIRYCCLSHVFLQTKGNTRYSITCFDTTCKALKNVFGVRPLCSVSKPSGKELPRSVNRRTIPNDGYTLQDFVATSHVRQVGVASASGELQKVHSKIKVGWKGHLGNISSIPYEKLGTLDKVYVETYGCQMNVSDTDIIQEILVNAGFELTTTLNDATIVLFNTCAVRDKAERKIWHRLDALKRKQSSGTKKQVVGVLGCMAERLKEKLLEGEPRLADIVVGPDSYRDLPYLLATVSSGQNDAAAYNVQLSMDETYADVSPVRFNGQGISAFVSVMRGCDNFCTFCVVPFTRGKERSRPVDSILSQVQRLSDNGFKEVVLLGQNVNSYNDISLGETDSHIAYSSGFSSVYKPKRKGISFAELIRRVCQVNPNMRIRFTSPHPKDFPEELLDLYNEYPNLCRHIHLPVQSGSSSILKKMRRGYTKEAYLSLVNHIKEKIPNVSFSSDFIVGFCGETELDHRETLDLMMQVKYSQAFTFAYSERSNTFAAKHLVDDVPADIKGRRLQEVIQLFRQIAENESIKYEMNSLKLVLVNEKETKDGKEYWVGRAENNKKCFISNKRIYSCIQDALSKTTSDLVSIEKGDYIVVRVCQPGVQRLYTQPIARSSIQEFRKIQENARTKDFISRLSL
ncbi:hypothetical protein GpartN1_g869.t1 [Galdieria partita]|uniref:CDK5RAP1-like protein n=1 Tax=Galdieria partita TaxID=83374 RepID=A0A9C7PQU9_9RHOD|nr:hypothetical protein GpartN1_g869.t1 [Galdieria partita]